MAYFTNLFILKMMIIFKYFTDNFFFVIEKNISDQIKRHILSSLSSASFAKIFDLFYFIDENSS